MQVGNRQIKKRIHVRVEHVQPSRCREDFLKRRVENDAAKVAAKAAGGASGAATLDPQGLPHSSRRAEKADTKRKPKGPRDGFVLENVKFEVRNLHCAASSAAPHAAPDRHAHPLRHCARGRQDLGDYWPASTPHRLYLRCCVSQRAILNERSSKRQFLCILERR